MNLATTKVEIDPTVCRCAVCVYFCYLLHLDDVFARPGSFLIRHTLSPPVISSTKALQLQQTARSRRLLKLQCLLAT